MKRLLYIIILIIIQPHTLLSQSTAYLLPEDYIVKMNIKKITEFKISSKDTTLEITYFYKNGKISQRTRYESKNTFRGNELDTCYKGSKIIFYENFTYDNNGRLNFTASTWTGLKEPYINTSEYSYSKDGDTTYMKTYNFSTGISNIWKDPHLNNRDSIRINNNCIAYYNSNKDTIYYKFSYHQNDLDSIIYSSDFIISQYHYYVFKKGIIVNCGIIAKDQSDSNTLISSYQVYFDNYGLPYKSSNFHFSDNKTFTNEIKVETY